MFTIIQFINEAKYDTLDLYSSKWGTAKRDERVDTGDTVWS